MAISARTPESRQLYARIQRAIAITERLNRLAFDQADAIRDIWTELTGQPVDPTFSLIPPFYSEHGLTIGVGRRVFINQACILNDIGRITHRRWCADRAEGEPAHRRSPLDPADRRRQIVPHRSWSKPTCGSAPPP